MIEWITGHSAVLLAIGWGVSELLAEIPQVKSNSVFQAIRNGIKGAWEKAKSVKPS